MNKGINKRNIEQLPIIDWDLAIQLAGHQKQVAEELLGMFMASLPNDYQTIRTLYLEQKYPELLQQVHKLHGALCYCGLPRLKSVIACLETDLKNNIMINLPSLFEKLNREVKLLLKEHFSHHHF